MHTTPQRQKPFHVKRLGVKLSWLLLLHPEIHDVSRLKDTSQHQLKTNYWTGQKYIKLRLHRN